MNKGYVPLAWWSINLHFAIEGYSTYIHTYNYPDPIKGAILISSGYLYYIFQRLRDIGKMTYFNILLVGLALTIVPMCCWQILNTKVKFVPDNWATPFDLVIYCWISYTLFYGRKEKKEKRRKACGPLCITYIDEKKRLDTNGWCGHTEFRELSIKGVLWIWTWHAPFFFFSSKFVFNFRQ